MEEAYGSRTLKTGDIGDDVYELQVRLVAFGASGKPVPCDGKFDAHTAAAVQRFCKYFSLPEQAIADARIFTAIDEWAKDMQATMKTFLEDFHCKCFKQNGDLLANMNTWWKSYVKGKLKLADGSPAGDPTCKGFGNGLKEVAIGDDDPWSFAVKRNVVENPGISKILFWAVMGVHKIFETDDGKKPKMSLHDGYRCNRDYARIKYSVNLHAAMGNHVGCAVDFHLLAPAGGSLRSPTHTHLPVFGQGAEAHCSAIRDDLLTFGAVENLDDPPRNHLRLEPRNKAPVWVHLDATVYDRQTFVQTVEDAMKPASSGAYAIPLDVGNGTELNPASVTGLYKHIEKDFAGGYFPVGGNTVWHGGVHLKPTRSPDVHASITGRLVAARLAEDPAKADGHYGSRNFLLMEHARGSKKFFSLYMHVGRLPLQASDASIQRLRWVQKAGGQQLLDKLKGGGVVKLDCPVNGGEPLWVAGEYGSPGSRAKMLHWEFFSAENLFAEAPPPATDPPLEGETGWSSEPILVKAVARVGTGAVYADDTLKLAVTRCNFKDAQQSQYSDIQWSIESSDHAFKKDFPNQGLKLEFKIPPELAGKTIRAWAFKRSKNDRMSVSLTIAPGKRQDWIVAEDNDGNFNADNEKILGIFPAALEADGLLTTRELVEFYKSDPNGAVEKLRFAVCKFTSEWGVANLDAAVSALKNRGFFGIGLKDKIAPYVWWSEAKSAGVELPASALTWHYHPVKLLETFGGIAIPDTHPPAPAPVATTGWTVTSKLVEKAKAMAKLHMWKRLNLEKGIQKEKAKDTKHPPVPRAVTDAEIAQIQSWAKAYEKHQQWSVLKGGAEPPDPGPQPAKLETLAGAGAPAETHEKPTQYEVTSPDGIKWHYEDHVYSPYTIFDDGVGDAGTVGGLAKMTSVFQSAGIQAPDAQTAQKVLATVSTHEGKLDAINTYDTGYISAGFIQFIAGENGTGSLATVLTDMKEHAPDAFKTYFSDLWIDVSGGALSATDPDTKAVSHGAAAIAVVRKDKRVTALFQYVGRKCEEYQYAQARVAYKRYYLPDKSFTLTLKAPVPDHPEQTHTVTLEGRYKDVLRSEAGKVACVDRAVQRGENKTPKGDSGGAPDTFARACQSVVKDHHLSNPTIEELAKYEREIVNKLKNRHDVLNDPTLTQPPAASEA